MENALDDIRPSVRADGGEIEWAFLNDAVVGRFTVVTMIMGVLIVGVLIMPCMVMVVRVRRAREMIFAPVQIIFDVFSLSHTVH